MAKLPQEGKLTPEEQEKARTWLSEKWRTNAHCSVCLSNDWHISDRVVAPLLFNKGTFNLGGGAFPQIMVNCKNCGHTVFFNAVMMGVLIPPEKSESTEDDSNGE